MISLGLLGYPLHHSLSPIIHCAALDYCSLQGIYTLYPISPKDQQGVSDLIGQMRDGEIAGLNVTIPYKQSVISHLDEITATAQAVGAVNTIFMQNEKLTGHNTDARGFLVDIHKLLDGMTGGFGNYKQALILGAGGAARAVAYALVNDGWKVILTARRLEQAQKFIEQFPSKQSSLSCIEYQPDSFAFMDPEVQLVVNATQVGMLPNNDHSPWPLGVPFLSKAVYYDLVYNPRETKFVQDARTAGLRAATGIGMLVEQAALAFEVWTGIDVPRDILFDSLEEK